MAGSARLMTRNGWLS